MVIAIVVIAIIGLLVWADFYNEDQKRKLLQKAKDQQRLEQQKRG